MRGRPRNGAGRNLSDSLLMAAESQLRDKSHLDLTCREIAEAAGTQAAMVNYYFQGKEGLLLELFNRTVRDIDQHLDTMEADIESNDGDPTECIVRGIVAAYYHHAALSPLFFIELYRANTPIGALYLNREFSSVRVERIIRKLIAKGIYRPELDPVVATWMLLGLVITPLAAMPMCPVQLDTSIGSLPTAVWIENIVRMLRNELLANGASHSDDDLKDPSPFMGIGVQKGSR
ncbi:TetR/AcrR family transcriptional regulator [Sphingobium sp. AN558]|uniref:TetR/AcrR family transcriptional regulator n=1 Tax=Sphingobium sp. AN558 TaxID=3133442 RepID=UPI0030BD5ED2